MSTLRLAGLRVSACSGLTLSGASSPHLKRRGLAPPNGSNFYCEARHTSLSRVNLQDPAGVPENILYLPGGRQGGNVNLSANYKNGLSGAEAV
jgi:hypothetical protein